MEILFRRRTDRFNLVKSKGDNERMVLVMVTNDSSNKKECPFCYKGIGKKVGKTDWLVCDVCKELFITEENPNFNQDEKNK